MRKQRISLHETEDMAWTKIADSLLSQLQADKLQTLIKAAKVEEVEPIWTSLFAKVRCLPPTHEIEHYDT
jgi:hypothetical protein